MLTIGSSRLLIAAAALASCLVLRGCEQQGAGSSSAGASPSLRPSSSLAQRAAKSERPTSNAVQSVPRRVAGTPKPSQGPSLSSVYANSLQVDAQHLVAANGAGQTSCSGTDLAGCRAALQQVGAWATALQRDLEAHPAPDCMKSADATLRSAIDLSLQGAQLGTKGIDEGSTTELTQGNSLLGQGTTRLMAASPQLGQSSCSGPPPSRAP